MLLPVSARSLPQFAEHVDKSKACGQKQSIWWEVMRVDGSSAGSVCKSCARQLWQISHEVGLTDNLRLTGL